MSKNDADQRRAFEREAESLVVEQLDLLAQLERQLRAVHRTMRQIEKVRSAKTRHGVEVSNGRKEEALDHLANDLNAIDQELNTQHESCHVMLDTVNKMRERLRVLRDPSAASSHTLAWARAES